MRPLLLITTFCLIIFSCNRPDEEQGIEPGSCLETTFFQPGLPERLQTVFFLDGKTGFVGGLKGGIYKTADSAKTWTALSPGIDKPVRDLLFLDAQNGFAAGGEAEGFILKTTDGGIAWANVHTSTNKTEMTSIYFVNATTGFCVGGSTIFKTTDGGQHWNEHKFSNLGGNMMQVRFTDELHGYIACLFNKVIYTADGGQNWAILHPNSLNTLNYYSLSLTGNVIYLSGQGKVMKSVPGVNSWNVLPNSPADIFAVHFISAQKGFAFGRGAWSGGDMGRSYGAIYCTENGGANWKGSDRITEIGPINAVSFPTGNFAYAISGSAVIRLKL